VTRLLGGGSVSDSSPHAGRCLHSSPGHSAAPVKSGSNLPEMQRVKTPCTYPLLGPLPSRSSQQTMKDMAIWSQNYQPRSSAPGVFTDVKRPRGTEAIFGITKSLNVSHQNRLWRGLGLIPRCIRPRIDFICAFLVSHSYNLQTVAMTVKHM
jgi:hypothetical protein